MPVEIRELIIKTEVFSGNRNGPAGIKPEQIHNLKKQLMDEFERMLAEKTKKSNYKR